MPVRLLSVIRFPVGGIRSYLRYTYSRLDTEAYTATIVAVFDREAHLLPAGIAPLKADLKIVQQKQALLRLSVAAHGFLRTGRFGLVHSQGTTAAVASTPSAKMYRVPHVVTLHETFRAEQFSGVLGAAKRRVLGRVLRSTDAIVVVGQDARENLLEHLPLGQSGRERIKVIKNGVAVDTLLREATETRPDFRTRLAIGNDTALLGFIGRFMPEKGFDVLLDAVRLLMRRSDVLPPFRIIAVNDGAFVREYRRQISAWGMDALFFFAGFQPSAAGALQEFDAVVMPSRREACPLVAMEAMVLGCPLIASDCIGLRELTAGSPAVTSVANDPGSLASAIEQFLQHRQESAARARAYIPSARATFDSARSADTLMALFASVLRPRRSSPSF